jgi:predicted ester cyclase
MNRIISEGDIVMMYSTTTGTHDHEWLGNPPTGNKLSFDVVDIFRIEDGKIAEHWDVADTMRMAMQLGRKMQE